jgi:hypothetical protein
MYRTAADTLRAENTTLLAVLCSGVFQSEATSPDDAAHGKASDNATPPLMN